jgi:hypothetical protein
VDLTLEHLEGVLGEVLGDLLAHVGHALERRLHPAAAVPPPHGVDDVLGAVELNLVSASRVSYRWVSASKTGTSVRLGITLGPPLSILENLPTKNRE